MIISFEWTKSFRLGAIVSLLLVCFWGAAYGQNRNEGNPFERHYAPIVYIDQPTPLGGYEAIQRLIIYPDSALALKLEGTVIVSCSIDTDGYAQNVLPILGPELLFNAAIDAVELSHWIPAKLDGEPILQKVSFPLDFRLPDSTPMLAADQPPNLKNVLTHVSILGVCTGLVLLLRGYVY